MTTKVFGCLVRVAASNVPDRLRWYGKAYIHHVWLSGAFQARYGMDFAAFKARLWEACNAGVVELCRADMVEAMSPVDVKRSNMEVMGATFNFVRV